MPAKLFYIIFIPVKLSFAIENIICTYFQVYLKFIVFLN